MMSSARLADRFLMFWNKQWLFRRNSSSSIDATTSWAQTSPSTTEPSRDANGNLRAFDFAASGGFLSVHHGETTWSEFKAYDIDRPYHRESGLWESCVRHAPERSIMSKLQQVIRDEIEQQGFDADGFDIMGPSATMARS